MSITLPLTLPCDPAGPPKLVANHFLKALTEVALTPLQATAPSKIVLSLLLARVLGLPRGARYLLMWDRRRSQLQLL